MQVAYFQRGRLNAMLQAYRTALISGAEDVRLFKNVPALNDTITLASLDEPVGTWYTMATTVPISIVHDGTGLYLNLTVGSIEFDYSGVSPAETIQGAALTDGAGNVVMVWMLESPVLMAAVGDAVITPVANCKFPAVTG